MCGISGCKLNRPLTTDDLIVMRNLRDRLAHRGPDDQGEWYDCENGIYLGHRRLSIIDLDARSAQPLLRDHLRISYNGEVYNYKEIRETLTNQFDFTTTGDTEVIIRAWQSEGERALERFDGMFAFALYDQQDLILATDAFGEKPIFYYRTTEGFFFASEASALIDTFKLNFQPQPNEIADFLYLGYIRPPATGFSALSIMPPASVARLRPDGSFSIKQWWQPTVPAHSDKVRPTPFTEQEINNFRDILCHSLELRLRADVPLGLFLSGGVDSSLLAAIAICELGQTLQTYTVSFPDGADESNYAKSIAHHLSLPHHIINSASSELWQETPRSLSDFYGVPNDNMTVLAVQQMCKAAKPYLTVALSGLGGDELFYGYNKYNTLYKRRIFYRQSVLAHKIFQALSLTNKKFKLAADLLKGSPSQQYLRLKNGVATTEIEHLVDIVPEVLGLSTYDLVHQVRQFDLTSSMPQSYIPATDRGSMKAAVEVRAPFLSRELYQFSSELGLNRLIDSGGKALPRALLSRYLPLDHLTPGKQGFTFPARRYLAQAGLPAPTFPELNDTVIASIWKRRMDPALQSLALRLIILSEVRQQRQIT